MKGILTIDQISPCKYFQCNILDLIFPTVKDDQSPGLPSAIRLGQPGWDFAFQHGECWFPSPDQGASMAKKPKHKQKQYCNKYEFKSGPHIKNKNTNLKKRQLTSIFHIFSKYDNMIFLLFFCFTLPQEINHLHYFYLYILQNSFS